MANRKSNQGIFVILLTWQTTPYNHTTYAMDTIFQLTWSVITLLHTQYGILTPLYKFLCLLSIHPLGHTTKTPLLWSYLGPSVLMPIYKPHISHCPYTIRWGGASSGFSPHFPSCCRYQTYQWCLSEPLIYPKYQVMTNIML